MMVRTSPRPGFRFHPTDVELVKYYLKRKVMGKNDNDVISEINIYKHSPWDLRDKSCLGSKDLEWYFFCPKETKNANGVRMNRATDCGYWKPTGKDRDVSYNNQIVAKIKSLVFHKGHAQKGERTNWVMHEYRMLDKELEDAGVVQDAYVLCKVFQKSGLGPKNGAQYGARFNENDYDDDGEIIGESSLPVAPPPPALPSNNSGFLSRSASSGPLGGSVYFPGSTSGPLSDSVFVPGSTYSGILSDSVFDPGSTSIGPLSDPGPSEPMLCADEVPPPMPDDSDELSSMLDKFREDYSSLPREDDNNEVENFGHATHNEGLACLHGIGSGDLYDNWAESSGGGFSLCSPETTGLGLTPVLAGNDSDFLELKDLDGQLDPALDQSPLQSPLGSDSFSPTLIKGDPPPAETTKLNTDGCRLQGNGKAGFGGLFQNFQNKEGVWMLDFYGKVECNSSLEAELWGIYRGLTIMLEKGMTNIMIETCSHEAVKLITGGPDPSCPYRALVDDSRLLMIRTSSSLSHISREANEYADYLARRGAEQDEHLVVCEY